MTETIPESEIFAKNLAIAVINFGIKSGLLKEDVQQMGLPQLQKVLDDAATIIASANELVDAGKALGNGISVDIFWERQGWYFVHKDDITQVSEEYLDINACLRYLVLHGYTINEIRRTRGNVPQPNPPLPPRLAGGE